jgi:tRNA 2-selenouridine synthase
MHFKVATLAQLAQFDEIIDVRSPGEFAEDHLPGAINCPVLDDAERIQVGTLYKQVSPFEARKLGRHWWRKTLPDTCNSSFTTGPNTGNR